MDFDILKEFEAEGGCFLEEADDDICIAYGDGTVVHAGKQTDDAGGDAAVATPQMQGLSKKAKWMERKRLAAEAAAAGQPVAAKTPEPVKDTPVETPPKLSKTQ